MAGAQLTNNQEIHDYIHAPLDAYQMPSIEGNAPYKSKVLAARWQYSLRNGIGSFGKMAPGSPVVKELWIQAATDNPEVTEVFMVSEVEVTQGMCDSNGNAAPACVSLLIDEGSGIALHIRRIMNGAQWRLAVSQNLNVTFHSPAPIGTRLTVLSRSVTSGGILDTCRAEIWDMAGRRLIASGTHSIGEESRLTPVLRANL